MRKDRLLDALFPRTRQAILATALMDPAREWYLSDLARHLGVRPSSLQRELASLAEGGILRRRVDGNRTYYRAETNSPIFGDLRELMLKTAGLRECLADALTPFQDRIQVAFVYGSVARSDAHAASDIDLMIVGRIGLSELAQALREAEGALQRPVNPSIYTTEEFARKLAEGHHFLAGVMQGEKVFILGDSDDLEAALGREASSAAHHEQTRA
jgi:DNA-binding transcriptional ArsR family regulator